MDDVSQFVLVPLLIAITVCFWCLNSRKFSKGKSMPGPPVFGGLKILIKGLMNNTLHLGFTKLAEKYGDIIQINLIIKKIVIVNNSDIFKRLVKEGDFRDFTNDRPPTFFDKYVAGSGKDITLAPFGPDLQQKRRIFHTVLKLYGEGKGRLNTFMTAYLTNLVEAMKKQEIVDFSVSIQGYILTLIGFILTGDNSEATKENLDKIQNLSLCAAKMLVFGIDLILSIFPLLRIIPGLRYKELYDSMCKAKSAFHNAFLAPTKKTLDLDQKLRVIDDLLLSKQKSVKDVLSDEVTIAAVLQNFAAGAYVTSTAAINSLFLHIIFNPDIQYRIYEEITKVIGISTPNFKHRKDMPYTEAVMLESLRYSSNLPLLVPHSTREDIVFDGYFIPKSTTLLMNAWHNHHREDFWKDPWTFSPDRFLDANGQLLDPEHPTRQKMIPFGTGRRQCPGESFGKFQVFFIVTFLLQHFEFLPDGHEPLPPLSPKDWVPTLVLSPLNYKCKVKIRNRQ